MDSNNKTIEYSTTISNIILTEFLDSDDKLIVEYLSEPEIHKNLDYLPQPYTLNDAHNFIQWCRDLKQQFQKNINFAIRDQNTGQLIGSCGFNEKDLKDNTNPTEVGIGYWIGKKHWGKGIGTAVVNALSKIGFNEYGYSKLYANVFEWNIGSQKILFKNEFVKEKILNNYVEKNGKLENVIKISKVKN
ncbi:acyl-CoA N-acyltransferase [Anaeromyces robustus]|uniref:Acyl-CoA N-acyltransferase n=1 Tax=Anaeromyces robustus TaxID=1754192 RepID=A0A1Y1XJL3_9FUNG|nr:acyl-CoA N-acyltransferase [Anaeromyces robustus]|eukprot:ORX85940.1 acyl-CoA N-acyltransferase [Anaeromyces robustus]